MAPWPLAKIEGGTSEGAIGFQIGQQLGAGAGRFERAVGVEPAGLPSQPFDSRGDAVRRTRAGQVGQQGSGDGGAIEFRRQVIERHAGSVPHQARANPGQGYAGQVQAADLDGALQGALPQPIGEGGASEGARDQAGDMAGGGTVTPCAA